MMMNATPSPWPVKLTKFAGWMIVIGLVLAVVAGPLSRFGITGFIPALLTLAGGMLLLVLGGLLALVGYLIANSRGLTFDKSRTLLGIGAAVLVGGYLLSWVLGSRGIPTLHEISTDLDSPPAFVAVKPLRDAVPGTNPSDYVTELTGPGGKINVPEGQRKGYPDIQPLVLTSTPAETFAKAEAAVKSLGWDLVAAVPDEGRIEATDTTFFFGFKDDVVIRIRAEGTGSRVDVRSKSRVGLGDAGTNAKRVRKLLGMLK
jgi:uncharacterized protein (DUF1499 family)